MKIVVEDHFGDVGVSAEDDELVVLVHEEVQIEPGTFLEDQITVIVLKEGKEIGTVMTRSVETGTLHGEKYATVADCQDRIVSYVYKVALKTYVLLQ